MIKEQNILDEYDEPDSNHLQMTWVGLIGLVVAMLATGFLVLISRAKRLVQKV